MTLRNSLKSLLSLVLGLPILQVVLVWVSGLLSAMGDIAAAGVLGQVNTATRVIWIVSVVALVVVLAVQALDKPENQ